jgi:small subunit ribosomal protein S20
VATKKKVSSAEKAHRQSVKRRTHNRQQRGSLRTALKSIRAALEANDLDAAKASLGETFSIVDKMANKGIIHRNTAGRYKSRIAKRLAPKAGAA